MQLPAKAHYATVAMLALAMKLRSGEVVPARVIARDQHIPPQFLGQILQQLRSTGFIGSTRGASGGFYLAVPPEDVSVGQIVDAICPANSCASALNGNSNDADTESPLATVVLDVWAELSARQREVLARISLADLLERVSDEPASMFYI